MDTDERSSEAAALFCEQGSGKTYIACAIIERLIEEYKEFYACLIVPSSNIETTWARKLPLIKTKLNIARTWEEFEKLPSQAVLLISHDEITPRKQRRLESGKLSKPAASAALIKKATRYNWSVVLWDETHKLKDRNSGISKTAAKFLNTDWKLALTGTPFDELKKKPHELWAQFRFLAPEVFGTKWGEFAAEFCMKAGYMGTSWKFRPGALEEVLELAEPFCIRVLTSEILNLKEPVFKRVSIPLRGRQLKTYLQMQDDLVVRFPGRNRKATAPLTLTQYLRLQQIAGGYLQEDSGIVHKVGSAKADIVVELVASVRKPVVIFCRFLPEIDTLKERLKEFGRVATIQGNNKEFHTRIQDRFQAGKIDYLIVQVKTGGQSIDLFRSSVGIFYSTTFSYIDFDQAWKRLHRNGQKRRCRFYLLSCIGTIDEVIYDRVISKENVNRQCLSRFIRRSKLR